MTRRLLRLTARAALHLAAYPALIVLAYLGLGIGLALNPVAGMATIALAVALGAWNTIGLARAVGAAFGNPKGASP